MKADPPDYKPVKILIFIVCLALVVCGLIGYAIAIDIKAKKQLKTNGWSTQPADYKKRPLPTQTPTDRAY